MSFKMLKRGRVAFQRTHIHFDYTRNGEKCAHGKGYTLERRFLHSFFLYTLYPSNNILFASNRLISTEVCVQTFGMFSLKQQVLYPYLSFQSSVCGDCLSYRLSFPSCSYTWYENDNFPPFSRALSASRSWMRFLIYFELPRFLQFVPIPINLYVKLFFVRSTHLSSPFTTSTYKKIYVQCRLKHRHISQN